MDRKRLYWVTGLAVGAFGLGVLIAFPDAGEVRPDPSSPYIVSSFLDPGIDLGGPGPAILVNTSPAPGVVEATLHASVRELELVEGVRTEVFAYNGRVPGPTLEVREGDRVRITFRNDLPEPTTVHWHGLHVPVDADGSPMAPVLPGQQVEYQFTIPVGSAGTYWYHPHPHGRTGAQVAKGLYGGIIVRAADDPLAPLPEKLILLSDNRFTADGAIDISDPLSVMGRMDAENGREGDVIFVSGEILPTIAIRSGEIQRWRVVNASASRVYRLSLPGHTLLHVGNDGGLFERAVAVDEITIANGERVELLVRGSGAPGDRVVLSTLPYDRYIPQTRPQDWDVPREVLTLEYSTDEPVAPPVLPAVLRPIVPIDPSNAVTTRVIVMSQGFLDNRPADMHRIDQEAALGATEIWEVQNIVGMDHPFHLHGFQFQLLERNGVPEPFPSWKDTVNVPAHQKVRFVVRYDDYPGRWMYHCHILDHEDQGMMGVLLVN